ncbi:protein kinase 3 [Tieghemostelium lacteum]|uniref:non-specific serine/threonine protein kinase n=1 Tax=Tieghemostelium lacteum TaxID=361077 RepID=A0A151ZB72_TIELA|nr:protein kinase 3 [Tieghemostelium lacteum]|eukprot:KYQ91197.1 protein kinase 3 [Tieghemostelium lacteum]
MSFKHKGNSKTPAWFPGKKERDLSHHKDGVCSNFDVIKVNNYGKRQQRTLAVSQHGVSNLNGPTCQWFVHNSDVYSICQDEDNLHKFTLTFLHRYHFEAESPEQAKQIILDFKKYNVGVTHYIADNDSSLGSNGSSNGSLKDNSSGSSSVVSASTALSPTSPPKSSKKKDKKDKKERDKEKEKERERQFLLQSQTQSLNNYNKLWQSSTAVSSSPQQHQQTMPPNGGNNLTKSQNVSIEKKLNNNSDQTSGLSPLTPTAAATTQVPNTPNTFSVEGARVWKIRAEELKQQFQQKSTLDNNNNNVVVNSTVTSPPKSIDINSNGSISSNNTSTNNSNIIQNQFKDEDYRSDQTNSQPLKLDLQQVNSTDESDKETKTVKKNSKKLTIDDFDLLKVLGVGSFGRVFLVRKKNTTKLYAMKVLSKKDIMKKKQIAHTNTEKMVLSTMDHPFIVRLHYAFQNDDFLFLCMDYIPGGELFHHLQKAGKFPEELAKFYIAQVILALNYLHSNDIIYRDIKPENILLDEEGHIKLTDFGLSKSGITSMVGKAEGQFATTFCGTPEYLAPEIIQSKGHGKAVDWWGVGVLLYEILAGRSPFICSNRNDMYKSMIQGNLRIPMFLSSEAQDLLEKLLVPDPTKRLGSNGSEEIMNHPFFELIPWRMLESKMITPPFKPTITPINVNQLSQDPDLNPKLTFQKRISTASAASSASLFLSDQSQAFKNFSWNNEDEDHSILAEKTSIEGSSSTPPSPTNASPLRTPLSRKSTLRNLGRKSSV